MTNDEFRMSKVNFFLFILLSALIFGCHRKTIPSTNPTVIKDGRYDTEFPSSQCSDELASISRCVRKLYGVAYYKTYYFSESNLITKKEIASGVYKKTALSISVSPESVSGTATLIFNQNNRIALLTCAHTLDFPDTLVSYYLKGDEDEGHGTCIKSFSIKDKQETFIKDLPVCGSFVNLAMDPVNDIAIIGKKCEGMIEHPDLFSYSTGNAKELGWGSFIYIFGYPMGNLMVTHGIVSNPNMDFHGTFMTDALFNKGFSGGIVVAIRNGVPAFELVGMIKSAFSNKDYFLRPEKDIDEYQYNESAPYQGQQFVGTSEVIKYGVTYAVSIETIRNFYRKYRDELVTNGYDLDAFFLPGSH
jgi:hypothetical protein